MRALKRLIHRSLPAPVRYNLWGRWFQLWERWEGARRASAASRGRPTAARVDEIRGALRKRLAAGPGPSAWVLYGGSWYSNSFQRPQQMARALAEAGCPVVYHEPWVANEDYTFKGSRAHRDFVGVRDLGERLHLLRCPSDLLKGLIADSSPDALLMTWPSEAPLIPEDSGSLVVYEMVDSHELAVHADEAWRGAHRRWVDQADIMVATAEDLRAELIGRRPDTLLLPNGVALEDWRPSAAPPVPRDMADARRAAVVVGYHGAVAPWFDWDAWLHAARSRPDWSFVLVGPLFKLADEEVKRRVCRDPNVHVLGPKSYEELRRYTYHFDVATIPFVLNPVTHACSPLKLFEYMAAGKPIVASPMREILKYRSVLFAEGPEAFVARLDEAIGRGRDAEYRAVLEREARANTWRSRAETLRGAIESALAVAGEGPRRRAPSDARADLDATRSNASC